EIVSFERKSASENNESFVHAEIELASTEESRERLASDIRQILEDVRAATGDFDEMTARALRICEETASQRELVEVRDFLRWMVQGGFVFLGYRRYNASGSDGAAGLTVEFGSELGIFREREDAHLQRPGSLTELSAAQRKLFFEGPPLVISKSRVDSLIHRRRPMDSIAVRRNGPSGALLGMHHLVGLYMSQPYAADAQHIPIRRGK